MIAAPEVIHLIFKTHLDIGFTDLARNVAERYFADFIPRAIGVAEELRAAGDDRFCWTTGAWLIYEYLERAPRAERELLERAIASGDVAWHALPFTTHSELMDADLFAFGLSLSQELDRRFGRRTIAAKMTDVPGHTRAIVPLLAAAGIRFLHIGVNAASTPPEVPPVFVWRDPSGAEVVVMYQPGGYGDLVLVPGMPDALAFAHTGDNVGPQTAEQVRAEFAALRRRFPATRVIASTLDAFAERLLEFAPQLPAVTGEIGDTWIHGVGTDPKKVAAFRELSRLRRRWLAEGRVRPDNPHLDAFSRALIMVPEHTWGMDVKLHLADYESYDRARFDAARDRPNFRSFASSWAEQRDYLDKALTALEPTPLAEEARAALRRLEPKRPDVTGMRPLAPGEVVSGAHVEIAVDPATGAIAELADGATGHAWAGPRNLLALLRYQTFSQADYDRFRRQYNINKRATSFWAVPDYTKPGIAAAGAVSAWWLPQLTRLYHARYDGGARMLAELALPAEASERFGAPRLVTLDYKLPDDEPVIYVELQWFDKPACRLPEALWLSFAPLSAEPRGWALEKLGQQIDPLGVVRGGNRRLHAVAGVEYRRGDDYLRLDTLDAPLVAPGEPALLDFTNRRPPLRHGVHVNLYNNVWGTNFPMWYDEDARFRFVLRFRASDPQQ
jgi:hypothetical protein